MVVIAHDVDPLELVVWLPALCRKMGVPYCIVKVRTNKECPSLSITTVQCNRQHLAHSSSSRGTRVWRRSRHPCSRGFVVLGSSVRCLQQQQQQALVHAYLQLIKAINKLLGQQPVACDCKCRALLQEVLVAI